VDTLFELGADGQALGRSIKSATPPATEFFNDDGQGNVTSITQIFSLECTARFDPFGAPLTRTYADTTINAANGACNTTQSGTPQCSLANDRWYRGERRQHDDAYYQMGSRTYDPWHAGFLTPDSYRVDDSAKNLSIGTDPLTRNTYSYVNGDPVNLADPDGHWACGWTRRCPDRAGTAAAAPDYNAIYAGNRGRMRAEADRLEQLYGGKAAARVRTLRQLGMDDVEHPAQILEFDPAGRIVEVFGDLDKASSVGILVPGKGVSIGNYGSQLRGQAQNVQAVSEDVLQSKGLDSSKAATIAWLGYDTPKTYAQAGNLKRAEAGGEALAGFIRSLSSRRDRNVTLVGHSYGSAVVANAATRTNVSGVVMVGSPGFAFSSSRSQDAFYSHVQQLWAARAPGDPVAAAG
jgi:RHS repeat-associated protein